MINLVTFIYKGEIKLEAEAFQKFVQLADRFQLRIQDDQDQRKKAKLEVSTSINDLPPELLTKILSYLPTFDVLRNVGRVSKKFYNLSRDPESHINVRLDLIAMEKLTSDFLRRATLMRKLTVQYSMPYETHVRQMFRDREEDVELDDLVLALRDHQHLRSLEISAPDHVAISAGKSFLFILIF